MSRIKNAEGVTEPVLIIVSDADTAVSNELSANLAEYFPAKPEYITVSGLSHNELFYDTAVIRHVADFIVQNQQP